MNKPSDIQHGNFENRTLKFDKKRKTKLYTYLMFDEKSLLNFSKAIFRNEKMNFSFIFSIRFSLSLTMRVRKSIFFSLFSKQTICLQKYQRNKYIFHLNSRVIKLNFSI